MGNDVRRRRTFLSWCSDSNLIAIFRWGNEFGVVISKQAGVARANSGRSLLNPEVLRMVVGSAGLGLYQSQLRISHFRRLAGAVAIL